MNPLLMDCQMFAGHVERLLLQEIDEDQREALECHLEACAECRRTLEEAAAHVAIWDKATSVLKSDAVSMGSHMIEVEPGTLAEELYESERVRILDLLAPTDDPEKLGRLGPYEVIGIVGSGGMGIVLKAFDPALNRNVAIKVMAPHLATSAAARSRFAREAQAAAAIVHENVIEIHGVSEAQGLPYLVMPFTRGMSLQQRLDQVGSLSLIEILRIAVQAAAGLSAAHARGLVHRDIKPANVLLADGIERVKLTDFGLARAVDDATLTRTGVIAGTPQYMSPEQARGEAVDQKSDLFSLGSLMYAMCTGRPPFRAETSYGVMRRINEDSPRSIRELNPDIPEWMSRMIMRLMAKAPEERFESAGEVAELLERCLAHVQSPTSVALPQKAVKPVHRSSKRRLQIGGVVMTIAVAVLYFGLGWGVNPPDISGDWTGPGWGHVQLRRISEGEYRGTYDDTYGQVPGEIRLKWSRVERRFKGTWRETSDRFGKISVRRAGREVRGAWTVNKESKIDPGNPELADLLWKRPELEAKGPSSEKRELTQGRNAPSNSVSPNNRISVGSAIKNPSVGNNAIKNPPSKNHSIGNNATKGNSVQNPALRNNLNSGFRNPSNSVESKVWPKLFESVVQIRATSDSSGLEALQLVGNGFFIDEKGHVATHVANLEGMTRLTVHDGSRSISAKVLGHDKQTGLTLLKIEGAQTVKPLGFDPDKKLKVGATVFDVAIPPGKGKRSRRGIVSALERNARVKGKNYKHLIQSDISFEAGTSGGPLFDKDGAVVGIVVAIPVQNKSIGFALPADMGHAIFQKILAGSIPPVRVAAKGNTQRPKSDAEISLIELDLAEAQLKLEAAKKKLERARELNKKGNNLVPKSELAQMELETELADLELRRQKIRLNGALKSNHDTARELLELELLEATKRLEGAKSKLEGLSRLVKTGQVSTSELAKTDLEVRQLELDVRRKKLKLQLAPDSR